MRNLSVNGLPDMKPGEVADLPVAALADLQAELNHQIDHLKVAKTVFDVGLQMKYADRAGEARRNQGKDTGTARFEDGEYTVVYDLPKRVAWDQEKLVAVGHKIADGGDDVSEYIKTKYDVDERKYTAWPESIRKWFEPARTIKTGKPVIKIELAEREAAE